MAIEFCKKVLLTSYLLPVPALVIETPLTASPLP